ncbi:Grainyhead-like protein 2-like [Pseudocercospora fuligena]|uniref:Grainyhead-like protein 2-like n=1 Tax=Pseudocercospora fuligena TaxID=685502 RepID=A0A8H6RTV0_9PEZI|nr:Grainyhead-like protein 2-like [Pseudocercospora fuligena]
MFRNRRTSQKPSDELYRNFKANFPELSGANGSPTSSAPAQAQPTTSLAEALDIPLNPRSLDNQPHDIKDADPTPRGSNEPWNFGTSGLTPSLMDPNNHNFNMFANQMSGYYTPTPGGSNTLCHNQAGDLHTPTFGMGLGTPLSMPTSEGALHAGQQGAPFNGFQAHLPQHIQPHQFQNVNPFQMHQQQGFPPAHFTHQPSFESMEGPVGESPIDDMGMDMGLPPQHQSPDLLFRPPNLQNTMQPPPLHPSAEKFRYHVTLNAPTAMIKHADEIPVTYLNKGQAYTLNVVDTHAQTTAPATKYRTFVRVSFEDEQQRQKPAACWQLWKEGRGTNEAHQRGGRLQAVEYVDSGQMGGAEDPTKPKVDLECSSFDGFCVTWSPAAGASECPISVRFNFLSTDFSHSKGVKGIPVRLCAKTEAVEESTTPTGPEVCYCKVKLFRDHGAERKLSNDVAHVKKTIDKLNQQIAQIESGMRDLGKRKRAGSVAKGLDNRPGKVPKHRRTWSMTSVTSNGGRGSAEEDLHMKLMTLQDMFTSTRPASVLYLRGEDGDDPDLQPVKLTGEIELVRTDSADTSWERNSDEKGSSAVSPTPSNNSLIGSRKDSTMQQPTPINGPSRVNSNEWRNNPQTATMDIQPTIPEQLQSPPDNQPTKVQTRTSDDGTSSGWIEAVGVDHSYRPPPERPVKPVACFFVQPRVAGKTSDNYYRAIYLMKRSLKEFNNTLAMKCGIEPTQVLRTYRINRDGLHVLFDDECIRELPEGQDMTAEFCEVQPDTPVKPKREWDAGPTDIQCDGDLPTIENVSSTGYELKLLF